MRAPVDLPAALLPWDPHAIAYRRRKDARHMRRPYVAFIAQVDASRTTHDDAASTSADRCDAAQFYRHVLPSPAQRLSPIDAQVLLALTEGRITLKSCSGPVQSAAIGIGSVRLAAWLRATYSARQPTDCNAPRVDPCLKTRPQRRNSPLVGRLIAATMGFDDKVSVRNLHHAIVPPAWVAQLTNQPPDGQWNMLSVTRTTTTLGNLLVLDGIWKCVRRYSRFHGFSRWSCL